MFAGSDLNRQVKLAEANLKNAAKGNPDPMAALSGKPSQPQPQMASTPVYAPEMLQDDDGQIGYNMAGAQDPAIDDVNAGLDIFGGALLGGATGSEFTKNMGHAGFGVASLNEDQARLQFVTHQEISQKPAIQPDTFFKSSLSSPGF